MATELRCEGDGARRNLLIEQEQASAGRKDLPAERGVRMRVSNVRLATVLFAGMCLIGTTTQAGRADEKTGKTGVTAAPMPLGGAQQYQAGMNGVAGYGASNYYGYGTPFGGAPNSAWYTGYATGATSPLIGYGAPGGMISPISYVGVTPAPGVESSISSSAAGSGTMSYGTGDCQVSPPVYPYYMYGGGDYGGVSSCYGMRSDCGPTGSPGYFGNCCCLSRWLCWLPFCCCCHDNCEECEGGYACPPYGY